MSAGSTGLPIASGRDTWRVLKKLGRRHVPVLIAVIVLGMVSAASGLVIPMSSDSWSTPCRRARPRSPPSGGPAD